MCLPLSPAALPPPPPFGPTCAQEAIPFIPHACRAPLSSTPTSQRYCARVSVLSMPTTLLRTACRSRRHKTPHGRRQSPAATAPPAAAAAALTTWGAWVLHTCAALDVAVCICARLCVNVCLNQSMCSACIGFIQRCAVHAKPGQGRVPCGRRCDAMD